MPSTWLPDPSHYPEQLTPLSATVWFEAIGRGLHEAMREMRGPFAGFEARTELGWAYEGDLEVEWELDPGALRAAATGLAERWTKELRPRSEEITEALHRFRPEDPPADEAAALFDRMWDLVLEQWRIHFLAVVPAQVAIEMLTDAWTEASVDRGGDPLAPYRLLDGLPSESAEADREVWALAEAARGLGVEDILRTYPPGPALDRLRKLAHGRRWLRRLDGYLERFGGRARWHELSLPREVERPSMTLESVRLFLESGASPASGSDEARERFERETLSRAPDLAEVVDAAKTAYALKENHVYHIDYPGLLATREALLGFGRRLLSEGRLAALDDVWMIRRDDLRTAITDRGPLDHLVRTAREDLARGLGEGPRPYLGEPPAQVERHAVLEKFYGSAAGAATGRSLRGTGASNGVGEGPARVARDERDFGRVRSGDVLVATTTTPAWTPLFPSLAGLVTESGGILSHAAIVAREYGVPTVVGVDGATRAIPDGARVRVDGGSGEVRLLGATR